jgi:hypothetical protein
MSRRTVLLLLSLVLGSHRAGAQPVPARRLVQETRSEYARAKPLTLTAMQRWCTDPAASGCEFKNPASIHATPSGGLLAADAMGPLRLFDEQGHFVRELGRKGQGPGEYGFIIDAHVASDGYVTWFDNMQMRFTAVRLDGTPGPVRRLMPSHAMANLFVVDTQLVILNVPPHPTVGTMVDATYETVPATGTPRVIARVRTPSIFTPGSDMFAPPSPFAPRVLADVSPRLDVAHTNGDRAELDVFPSRGVPWHLTLDLPARTVTATERDSAIARALNRFKVKRLAELPPPLRAVYEKLPAQHAPLEQLKLLADGTVWIRPTPARSDTLARWDVFTFDGFRVGYAALPLSARVVDGARDWILVTDRDADDLPRFVRYRIARAR